MRALDFAISQALPEDMRRESYDVSKKGIGDLLADVASKHPEKYGDVVKKLADLGRHSSWRLGYSVRPKDVRPVIDVSKRLESMDAELKALRKKNLPPDEFKAARNEIMLAYSDALERETMQAAKDQDNAFALATASGARGNASHLKAILSTPGIFTDTHGRIVPLFVRNSYAQGVRPGELLAGTYGGRLAVTSTKNATAKGGDLLKIMTQATLNYNVVEPDCGVENGIDLDPEDASISGRVLAMPAGDIPAGTVVDKFVRAKIRKLGKPVVLRSAMTCQSEHGLCAKCVGVRPNGKLPKVGSAIGVTASEALLEPVVQGALNVKHNSGMAKGKREFSGLSVITQFLQIPDEFKDRAAVAEADGTVEKIEDAPQGGKYVTVNGVQHFVSTDFAPIVKVGDRVEAGDTLSEGLVNPADIVRLRGLGEGRRYYAERFAKILADSGSKPEPINAEIAARAAVDNYLIEDPDEDSPWNPDDVAREGKFLRTYTPPPDTTVMAPSKAVGRYLQKPALHYTVGTRLTPKMAKRLESVGFKEVAASPTAPWFKPDMERLRTVSHNSDDFLVGMGTSYLSSQLVKNLERSADTDVASNYHYGPRLAFGGDAGAGGFAQNIERTGKF